MSRPIQSEKFAEVLQLAQDTHLTTKEISEKSGVGYELTRQWLKKAGLSVKRPKFYEEREIIRNCEKSRGWQTRIAKELGISQQLVSKYYKKILSEETCNNVKIAPPIKDINTKKIIYRPIKGSLDKAMEEIIYFSTIKEMLGYLANYYRIEMEDIFISYYGYDDRIRWDTFILTSRILYGEDVLEKYGYPQAIGYCCFK